VRLQVDNRTLDLNVARWPSAHEFVVSEFEFAPREKPCLRPKVSDFRSVIMTSSSAPHQRPPGTRPQVTELESIAGKFSELKQKADRAEALRKQKPICSPA